MSNYTRSLLSQKYIDIAEKIKAFAFESPSNRGPVDPGYRIYLARCGKLFELDLRLHNLCNIYDFDNPDDFAEIEEELLEIEREVEKLTK